MSHHRPEGKWSLQHEAQTHCYGCGNPFSLDSNQDIAKAAQVLCVGCRDGMVPTAEDGHGLLMEPDNRDASQQGAQRHRKPLKFRPERRRI